MTPEQKQQLDDLKIRHRMAVFAFEGQEPPQAQKDIALLLSLVESQEKLARDLAVIVEVGTGDDPGTALSKLHKLQHDAATSMRSRCVEKVRAMGQQWYADAKKRGAAFSDKGRLAETIATELEKVIPQEQETPCADCAEAARLAYSDATTPGFFSPKCGRHQEPKQS